MKKAILFLIVTVSVLILSGCPEEFETTSISQRVDQLESDLNNDRLSAYQNLHPDASDRNTGARTEVYWENVFPGGPYTLSVSSITEPTAVVAVSPASFGSTANFTMKEDGEDNWKILSIDYPPGGSLEVQVTRDFAVPDGL
jgi:hypothetical protein